MPRRFIGEEPRSPRHTPALPFHATLHVHTCCRVAQLVSGFPLHAVELSAIQAGPDGELRCRERRGGAGTALTPCGVCGGAAQIMFAWFTGVSRIIDNKHSTADVVGGFVLGAMIGLAFVMKVLSLRRRRPPPPPPPPPHTNSAGASEDSSEMGISRELRKQDFGFQICMNPPCPGVFPEIGLPVGDPCWTLKCRLLGFTSLVKPRSVHLGALASS